MTELLKISLPDGSVREVEPGSTPADIAAAIGPGLAKAALAARVDGELRDLNRPFDGDAELALITSRDEADALELARHDIRVNAIAPGYIATEFNDEFFASGAGDPIIARIPQRRLGR